MLPALFLITLAAFVVSQNTPGDPVRQQLQGGGGPRGGMDDFAAQYANKRRELGLHLPVFYCALQPLSVPDTLYRIALPEERAAAEALCYALGNWPEIQVWRDALLHAKRKARYAADSASLDETTAFQNQIDFLLKTGDAGLIQHSLAKLAEEYQGNKQLKAASQNIFAAWEKAVQNTSIWKTWTPKIVWHGFENQYHHWLAGVATLDFGRSYRDGRPVTAHLKDALAWTLTLGALSLILSFGLALVAGLFTANNPDSISSRAATNALLFLYAVPDFWAATLLIIFFAGGDFLSWFPAGGVTSVAHDDSWSFGQKLADWAWHLALPLFCLVYGNMAVIGRQAQVSLGQELAQPYVLTARAKGLSNWNGLRFHAFPNALLPVITLFGGALPMLVTGAIIVETIFAVPGMGYLLMQSVEYRDYPVLLALFTLGGFLTQAGVLLADGLYRLADPRTAS